MIPIINLDLNKKNHPTSFGYEVPNTVREMYFRIVENDYVIDYSKFRKLTLRFQFENGIIDVQSTSIVDIYLKERMVKYNIPTGFFKDTGVVTVTPTVQTSNKTVVLSSFKLVLFEEDTCSKMNNILLATNYFNYMLSLYYDSIKRDQINQPNGIVGLDSDGKVPIEYFPSNITNHITDKIIDTKTKSFKNDKGEEIGIHGLRLDDKWRLIYFDSDDQEFYIANSIHGGKFGHPNKSSEWNIHGGVWQSNSIDAGTFNQTTENFVDGGTFNDGSDGEVDANFLDSGIVQSADRIFGGSWKDRWW